MLLPPITAEEPSPAHAERPIYSPRARSDYVAFRLFCGEEPATLSVKDQVAVTLARRIVERELSPGQKISEHSIAEEFGVSKAPVSDALMLLQYNGLVQSTARRSAVVAPMNGRDYDELNEYRGALSSVALVRFTERHTAADLRITQQYLEHLRELVTSEAGAFDFIEVADRSILHMAMQSGNRHVARGMSPLSLQSLRYWRIAVKTVRERKLVFGWWQEALPMIQARDTSRLLVHAALVRDMMSAEVHDALRKLG